MKENRKRSCSACDKDAPRAPSIERKQFRKEHPNWSFIDDGGIEKIRSKFDFSTYEDAINFTDEIAALAEFEDHHPTILLEWGRVTITWWTHKIGGLHLNDLILARETDHLYQAR